MSRSDDGDWRCITAVRRSRQRVRYLHHRLTHGHLRQRFRESLIFQLTLLTHCQNRHHRRRLLHVVSSPHLFPQTFASVTHRHVSFRSPISTSVAFPRRVHHLHMVMESMRARMEVRRRRSCRLSVGFHFCRRILYPCLFAKFWLDFVLRVY
jgi:hypothetical protein